MQPSSHELNEIIRDVFHTNYNFDTIIKFALFLIPSRLPIIRIGAKPEPTELHAFSMNFTPQQYLSSLLVNGSIGQTMDTTDTHIDTTCNHRIPALKMMICIDMRQRRAYSRQRSSLLSM